MLAPGIVAINASVTTLHLAGTYTCRVAASVARIRENVLDREYLENGRVMACA